MIDNLTLELTTACNFRCVHCFQERDNVFMDTAMAISLIDRADSLGVNQVVLTGGEPTLHPEFASIYRKARDLGFIMNVFTNAAHFNDSTWNLFTATPPHVASVTLYGFAQGVFTSVTGSRLPSSRVLQNVLRLKSLGIDVYLKFHAMTLTVNEVSDFVEFAKQNGCDSSVNIQIIPPLSGLRDTVQYRLNASEVQEIEERFGFNFTPSLDQDTSQCTLGDDLYVSVNGMIQGCPIFAGGAGRLTLESIEGQLDILRNSGSEIRRQRTLNRGVCPAWLHLEGVENVRKYLQSLGAESV